MNHNNAYVSELKIYTTTVKKLGNRFLNPDSELVNIAKLNYTTVPMRNSATKILVWLEKHTFGQFFMRFDTMVIGFEDPLEATYFKLGYKDE